MIFLPDTICNHSHFLYKLGVNHKRFAHYVFYLFLYIYITAVNQINLTIVLNVQKFEIQHKNRYYTNKNISRYKKEHMTQSFIYIYIYESFSSGYRVLMWLSLVINDI